MLRDTAEFNGEYEQDENFLVDCLFHRRCNRSTKLQSLCGNLIYSF